MPVRQTPAQTAQFDSETETLPLDDEEGRGYGPEEPPVAEETPIEVTPAAKEELAIAQAAQVGTVQHVPRQVQQPISHLPAVQVPEAPKKAALALGERGFDITDIEQAYRAATMFAKSTLVPKAFQNQPENVLVAMMWGRELGLSPMASLTGIAVISGTPSLWGDAIPGLCYSSGVLADHQEFLEGEGETRTAVCRVLRKGQSEWHEQRFGYQDAKRAGLLSKDTYKSYPDRMYMNRARAFAFRTKFADVLRGLPIAEEVQDYGAPPVPEVSTPQFKRLEKEETQA
jgi:hypothetical protein